MSTGPRTKGTKADGLGGWKAKSYTNTAGSGDAATSIDMMVYHNQGDGKSSPFSDSITGVGEKITTAGAMKDFYPLTLGSGLYALIEADVFEHSGIFTHRIATDDPITIQGTLNGASGTFRCSGSGDACTSTNDGKDSTPSLLTGVWHFKPDAGATITTSATNYQYFGWWVTKDSKGEPQVVEAFAGATGSGGLSLVNSTTTNFPTTGDATYTGKAAGKYAWKDLVANTAHGGHFTADAELKAVFGGDNVGISGTVDEFDLEGQSEDPNWSVELGRILTFDVVGLLNGDEASQVHTLWSVNENSDGVKIGADERNGDWNVRLYDDRTDKTNIPTIATGTFSSYFASQGTMEGAFGATN